MTACHGCGQASGHDALCYVAADQIAAGWQERAEKAEAELAHLRDVLRAAERGDCVSKSMLGNTCKCCKARRTPSVPPAGEP